MASKGIVWGKIVFFIKFKVYLRDCIRVAVRYVISMQLTVLVHLDGRRRG